MREEAVKSMLLLVLALQAIGGGLPAGGVGIPVWCAAAGCGGNGRAELVVDPAVPYEAIASGMACSERDLECAGKLEPVLAWRADTTRFERVRLPAVAQPVTSAEDPENTIAGQRSVSVPVGSALDNPSSGAVSRRQLHEYSDGFYARLALHRLASYGTLPLFAAQYFAGEELLRNVDHAAGWARAIHGPAAAGVAVLFLVNTVTGGMNVIEGIRDPADRGRRTVHSLLMLIADAGFVWTGVTASGAGRYKPDSNELRTLHRKVALGSMGVATLGYVIMIPPFRK
jgi:hypothetical protein